MTAVFAAGTNQTRLWGLTPRERLARIAAARGLALAAEGEEGPLVANLDFAFDPAWLGFIADRRDHVLTLGGVPILAHVANPDTRRAVTLAMAHGQAFERDGLTVVAHEESDGIADSALRKRERPFAGRLTPATVPGLERASYFGAYKGVTDLLTRYLWPEWALLLTRWAAHAGLSPNQVTGLGFLLCITATLLFYHAWYWAGLAAGLLFMVLDTVDGKLARCTITSSWWGDVLDHGIDLVHPPFWWWAWGVGLHAYGRPLSDSIFVAALAAIVGGYVIQRLVEALFILRFRIEIHVWRRFDSRFRLVTARRNPNMVILLAFLAVGRPDWGLIAVAGWTLASLGVHIVQLCQAAWARSRGRPILSWLA